MLFGGKQAFDAGVTGYRKPTAPEFYDFCAKERAAEKEIATLSKQHPTLKARFAEIASKEVASPFGHRVQDILILLKREVQKAEKAAKREARRARVGPFMAALAARRTPPQSN